MLESNCNIMMMPPLAVKTNRSCYVLFEKEV